MKKWRAGIIGATGIVGQRFVTLLSDHPWIEISALAASARSARRSYGEAVQGRWAMTSPLHRRIAGMPVYDAADIGAIRPLVDFVFCAVNMPKAETRALEEAYAKSGVPVVSNNSACRGLQDVPMLIPEINWAHLDVLPAQKKRLGTDTGFIVVKPNCSIQSYVPALTPLVDFGIRAVSVCTYQAISGAGKTFETWPDMLDNVIPYIGGEEEKSEQEPLKVWGQVSMDRQRIENAERPVISAQCLRVPVTDGHMAAVSVSFEKMPDYDTILSRWRNMETVPQKLNLPSAARPFLQYFEESDRPQTRLDRDLSNGMGISIGRLRRDSLFDWKFVCLSHNTLRGAAGGGVLTAELLCARGCIPKENRS